jgi:hypothetical protein
MRCHLENSTAKRGSGTTKQAVKSLKVGYDYYTGPEQDAIKLVSGDIDPQTVWDGFGDNNWKFRVYWLWASYFGPPKHSNQYRDGPFHPSSKAEFPVNPRKVDLSSLINVNINAPTSEDGTQLTSGSAFGVNDIESLRHVYGNHAEMLVFMFGDRALSDEEWDAVAASIQEGRRLKEVPDKEMLQEMHRRKVLEGQYGTEVFNHEPYIHWESTRRSLDQETMGRSQNFQQKTVEISQSLGSLRDLWDRTYD